MVDGATSSAFRTPDAGAGRRAAFGRVGTAVVLALLDLGLILLATAAMRWSAQAPLGGLGAAAFVVTAVSSAAGIAVLAVVAAANLTAVRAVSAGWPPDRAGGLAVLGQWLAVIRLVAVGAAAALVTAATGRVAGDLADFGLFCAAAVTALFAVLLAMTTARGVRR